MEPQQPALDVLERLPEVKYAGLASDHQRLIAGPGMATGQIRQALAEAGMQVQLVEPGAAMMKDVYVMLEQGTSPRIFFFVVQILKRFSSSPGYLDIRKYNHEDKNQGPVCNWF